MPPWCRDVRVRGQSGKHLLGLSLSTLTPSRRTRSHDGAMRLRHPSPCTCEIRSTEFIEYAAGDCRSVGLDIRSPDHLAPFLGFGCHVRTELRGTKQQWHGGRLSNFCLDYRIGQAGADFGIELLNDLRRHTVSDREAIPARYLKSRNRIGYPRRIREHVQSAAACHR